MAAKVEDKLLVIVGQTASGKTSLAIKLAEQFDGEIICADSRTVYKGADIGTAKPTELEQKQIRHHLLDIVEVGELFSVADFKRLADEAIADISARGKLPILVGGSGLYIDAVIYNYEFRKTVDDSVRDAFKDATIEELQSELIKRKINIPENSQNKRYLIRSLEAGSQKITHSEIRKNTLILGLDVDTKDLRCRSIKRTQHMFKDGLVDETRTLGRRFGWDARVLKAPAYVAGHSVIVQSQNEAMAIEQCVALDLKLAKKQRTWFRRNKHIVWVDAAQAQSVVHDFM